jgi:hypothetical protein
MVHFLGVADREDQVLGALDDFVGDLVVRLQQQLDLGVLRLRAALALRLGRQVHGRQIIVRLEQLLERIPHQPRRLLKRAELLAVHEQVPQLVPIDVLLQLAQHAHDGSPHALELGGQRVRDGDEHGLESAELVRQRSGGARVERLAQPPLEVVHEHALRVRVGRAVGVEDEHAVVLDQHAQVQQVDEDGRWADQDVREQARVDLAQVAREEAVLLVVSLRIGMGLAGALPWRSARSS